MSTAQQGPIQQSLVQQGAVPNQVIPGLNFAKGIGMQNAEQNVEKIKADYEGKIAAKNQQIQVMQAKIADLNKNVFGGQFDKVKFDQLELARTELTKEKNILEKEKSDLNAKLRENQEQNEKLKEKNEEQIKKANAEKQKLEKEITDLKIKIQKDAVSNEETEKLKKELATKESNVQNLMEKQKSNELIIEGKNALIKELQGQLESAKDDENLKQQLKNAQKDLETETETKEKLNGELTKLKSDNEVLISRAKAKNLQIEVLEGKLKLANGELENEKLKTKDLQTQLNEKVSQLSNTNSEIQKYKNEIASAKSKLDEYTTINKALVNELDSTNSKFQSAEIQIQQLQANKKTSDETIAKLKEELNANKIEQSRKTELEGLIKALNAQLQSEIQKTKQQLDQIVSQVSKIADLEKKVQTKDLEIVSLKRVIFEKDEIIKEKDALIGKLNEKLILEGENAITIRNLKEVEKLLNDKITSLQKVAQKDVAENKEKTQELEKLKKEYATFITKYKKNLQDYERLVLDLKVAKEEIQKLKSENEDLQKACDENTNNNLAELRRAQSELQLKDVKIAELQKSNEESQSKNDGYGELYKYFFVLVGDLIKRDRFKLETFNGSDANTTLAIQKGIKEVFDAIENKRTGNDPDAKNQVKKLLEIYSTIPTPNPNQ